MTNKLSKLTMLMALGSSFAVAQSMPQQQPSQQNPSSMPQTQQAPAATSNVQSDIQSAIQKDSSLASANVNVQVTSTAVELTGTAPTQAAKDKAEEIARTHAGGLDVKNRIKVSGASENPK